jgi:MFS transporter, ACS family, hexuronate transporter
MSGYRVWIPAAAMMLVSLISYVDRNTLAILAPAILETSRLSAEQYGWIISAFSVAYMVGNPLWGRWMDRIGVRWGMFAAVALWTVASVAHAYAAGFWGLAAARATLGFGEGATFPGGLRTVVQTLPDRWRSRGVALAYSGGSLGAVLAPLIVSPIYSAWGWRAAFLFTGIIGGLWLLLWAVLSRDERLRRLQPAAVSTHPLRWADARLWSFLASYALGCLPLAFVLYGASIFLNRVWGQTQEQVGAVLWVPPLGWEVGYFMGAWLLDRLPRPPADRLQPHRILTTLVCVLIVPLAAIPYATRYWAVLALLFWAMFVAGSNVVVAISYATEVYTTRHAGFLAGLGAGSWSAVVALLMPRFGAMFDSGLWRQAFLLATAVSMTGTGVWLVVNRRFRRP